MPLKIIIVGSGLAGLTAACILKDHDVTVFERGSESVATGGQGIMIAANGAKILKTIGFDKERAGAVEITGITTYDKSNTILEQSPLDLRPRFGANYMSMKRSDVRDELLRIATLSGTKLECNSNVVALDPSGSIQLEDGTKLSADIIIVADGVHSRLRKFILGQERNTKKTGLTCYRIVASPPSDAPTWMNKHHSALISDAGRMISAYPIRNGELWNVSCIVKGESEGNSWHADADLNKMLSHFQDFHPDTVKVLQSAKEVKIWQLQDLEPLPFWSKGKAILIGDAAHAMTPMQGQGANMSIEDGEAFRLLGHEPIEDILKTIGDVRRNRVLEVLSETRKSHAIAGVAERVIKNLEFNCGYDGIVEALKRREA